MSNRTKLLKNQYDAERALYNLQHADVLSCTFAGPADGESALKESRDVRLIDCSFSLRYPLWHSHGFSVEGCRMDEKTRAAIWYASDGEIAHSVLGGIKAVRECENIRIFDSIVTSPEFGWKSTDITLDHTEIESEYLFFDSRRITLNNVKMRGKYSFQYVDGLTIEDSELDTKDAFWHSRGATVRNSLVKGEYLGWYSEGLTLIGCRIIGTQPLCYCKDLTLIDCTMEACDLSFEYSDVNATVRGDILSVKNPRSGLIVADSVGEVIREDPIMPCTGEVRLRSGTVL